MITIVEKAMEKFMAHGFSRVTTDEISQELGISKKTLYKYYETKDKLVDAVLDYVMSNLASKFDAVMARPDLNPVDKMEGFFEIISTYVWRVSPALMQDLQRNRPDLFQRIMAFREQNIRSRLATLLKEGQSQGLIRQEIDATLAIDAFLAVVNTIMVPAYLINSPHSPKTAFTQLHDLFLFGILKKTETHP